MKHRKLGDNLSVRRQIGEPLIELAEGLDNKSDAAVVREIIAEIELALSRGISRKTILNTANEKTNRNIKFGAFVKILYRIRKRRKANNTNSKIIS